MSSSTIPLVIDLDGTLINTDLLSESLLFFILKNPFLAFKLPKYLFSGKANLKWQIAKVIEIDAKTLPYNQQIINLIKTERQKGRSVVLATASHRIYAQKIADHLQLFDQVFATEENINLSAQNKCDKLVKEFGEKGFDYVGNSHDDLKVWQKSRLAYITNPSYCLVKKVKYLDNIEKIFTPPRRFFKNWIKAIRLHQWVKNLLIFVPLFASHKLTQMDLVFNGLLAFLFFSLCASHVYLFNDLVDIRNDRNHPTKRFRPLAAGSISITSSIMLSIVFLTLAFVGSIFLMPLWFTISLIFYYLLTLIYSTFLKQLIIIDVITLAALYTIRIIAGTFAFGVKLTFWMLAFSMFIFLSLSLVKRYAELYEQRNQKIKETINGRGYHPNDLEILSSLGTASGYLAVMVLALYIQDQATISLYSHPRIIWFACPVFLYWISRIWMITYRGKMHDDPVVFAIKDRISWIIGIITGIIFLLAI